VQSKAVSSRIGRESQAESAKWTPSEKERAALDQYFARAKAVASVAPRIKVSAGADVTTVSLDHPDQTLGSVLLAQAFGVTSLPMAMGLVDQLVGLSVKNGKYDEERTNFMAAVIQSIKPRDELEAMLAAQMAAVHMATMTFARRLTTVETIQQQDSAERAFNKLTRTFTTQLEALKRYRTGGEQKVTVQHIDVRGGQAIVGDVSQGNRTSPSAASAQETPALTQSKAAPMPILNEEAAEAVVETKRK
jgi:hypothetical protein